MSSGAEETGCRGSEEPADSVAAASVRMYRENLTASRPASKRAARKTFYNATIV